MHNIEKQITCPLCKSNFSTKNIFYCPVCGIEIDYILSQIEPISADVLKDMKKARDGLMFTLSSVIALYGLVWLLLYVFILSSP